MDIWPGPEHGVRLQEVSARGGSTVYFFFKQTEFLIKAHVYSKTVKYDCSC